jgi:hypothetical protein
LALIRGGYFSTQARRLVECGTIDADGTFRCLLQQGRRVAPQLTGLLRWWPASHVSGWLLIQHDLLAELTAMWSLTPPTLVVPEWVAERKAVGDRAELYTMQLLCSSSKDPTSIWWVARESDSLGYDIEDRSTSPHTRIEVKGRRDEHRIFFLSENELKTARATGDSYHLYFWGEIDLNRPVHLEYGVLRNLGYPEVLRHLTSHLSSMEWHCDPVKWKVWRE